MMDTLTQSKTKLLTWCAVIAGITTMCLFRWLAGDNPPSDSYDFLWEKFIVSALTIFSFICGFIEPNAPWRWPLVMACACYFSGFIIMKSWGQIPPFELIYIGLLSLPAIAAGYLSAWMGKRIRRIK